MSAGQAVKAMILNGLGFVSGTLYMFTKYMDSYACEHLLGEGVLPAFAKTLVNFRENLDKDALMVADSALYSGENLNLMRNLKWLCRVPLTVGLAKQILLEIEDKDGSSLYIMLNLIRNKHQTLAIQQK